MCLKVVLLASVLYAAISPTVGWEGGTKFGRIYGSAAVFDERYAWMASIRNSEEFLCGGTVINKRTVLTTAECIHNELPKQLTVRVGSMYKSQGGQLIPVAETVYPESYEKNKWGSNIAILRLSSDIEASKEVQPLSLAREGEYMQAGTSAEVCGWGETTHGMPEFLHCVDVKVLAREACRKWYTDLVLNEKVFCASFEASNGSQCYKDSGGPLVANGTLVGIISWAWLDQCTRMYEPGVYTKVSAFIHWINSYLSMHGDEVQ